MTQTFGLSQDLPPWAVALAVLLSLLGLGLLLLELRRSGAEGKATIAFTGVLASVLALGAVLRPVSILTRGTRIGARVIILVDRSRSMLLPGMGGTREEAAHRAVEALQREAQDTRWTVLGFGERVEPWRDDNPTKPVALRSDLLGALRKVMNQAEELPQALVVVSDGRLELPEGPGVAEALQGIFPGKMPPIHAISVADGAPRDASVRSVKTAGAAVAHQPVSLAVEVGCSGGLSCDALPVAVRELLDGTPPALLASGIARVVDGKATLDLQVTLDRAGPRLVEIAIDAPAGDTIPENNRRILAFDVARERVRLLHVAGRPTYDVRALRTWLKSNASVDVIAFFILRTERSEVQAPDSELALIRFPVEELFTEQLPSFDAVVLQDFNAEPYRLLRYIPNLARYVEGGG
ncbi:MAG: VWA domain-containing protein, partial [Myxococcales bacterium]|nr:VWA domain-containing protein [Polyangiaceae bacterium]MDW8250678.1 VWA domain-containing protein [Myxococcales bacterium]